MSKLLQRTLSGQELTKLILEVFRLNGALLKAGDKLTKPFGLTSARWQVLGAIEQEGEPLSVAQISRRMGLSRQAVQRIANGLEKIGFVTFNANPDHKTAKHIKLTSKGQQSLNQIDAAQIEWVNQLAKNIDSNELRTALNLLQKIK